MSEWFPRRESGWAVALFDSGSSVGAAIAPWLVLSLYPTFGSWRPAFIITGALGFVWLALFLWLYRQPEDHPRITDEERADDPARTAATDAPHDAGAGPLPYATLLRLPQTWGYIVSKSFTDPVWFFITDWFAIYLVAAASARGGPARLLGAVPRRRSRQLLRRRRLELADRSAAGRWARRARRSA